MNYPVWDIPASGLLIAGIAILHVFISHFAVGGGLFLVLAERRARREHDEAFLGYVRQHSRFFTLLTLVLGAITGVGIWFTIGLVHPQATSSLINTFVWAWAIEWTFFVTEIAAAMVYYYGWDRLSARAHMAVGWIYFVSAYLSLVVINGILTYMMTPGGWITSRGFWDGFFNDTYWPALTTRTFVAFGLAGLYALMTASWMANTGLKEKVARYAGLNWIVPMAVVLPLSLAWYLAAAAGAGVPVAEILGAPAGSVTSMLTAAISGAVTGHPVAQRAAFWVVMASAAVTVLTLITVVLRSRTFGRPMAATIMVLGFVAMGGGEFVREDLRKPYVIGHYMFVNGIRLPASESVAQPPHDAIERFGPDRFTIDAVKAAGVLNSSAWVTPLPPNLSAVAGYAAVAKHQGHELFRALCSNCHTIDGYLALRPLVLGKSASALDGVLQRLAVPVDATGAPAAWNKPAVQLKTWRGRRMPPFAGTPEERQMLAGYLALLGGAAQADVAASAAQATVQAGDIGRTYFESRCAVCHGPGGMVPFKSKYQTPAELYGAIGRLPTINEMMPPFDGTEAERTALAAHLASLVQQTPKRGAK